MNTNRITPCNYRELLKRCPNLAPFLLQIREISGKVIHTDVRDYVVSHFADERNAELLARLHIDGDVLSHVPPYCMAKVCDDDRHPDRAANRAHAQQFWLEELTRGLQVGTVT